MHQQIYSICKCVKSTCLAGGRAGCPITVWSDNAVSLAGQKTRPYGLWTQTLWTPAHKYNKTGCTDAHIFFGRSTFLDHVGERLGYVCNPRSLKEGTETSRRRTDELGYRLERPIHFECKLNEPMHIGLRLLHPAAADHSVSISRQQVQRIFRFSLRSRAGARPLSGGTGAVATGRDVSVPSFRERGLHT